MGPSPGVSGQRQARSTPRQTLRGSSWAGETPGRRRAVVQPAHPNVRFQELCALAGIKPRVDAQCGNEERWELKDLRKTCATYYDEHMPESSIEILGHSVGGITYRHYAHRAPLAFRAIMTIPQPTAFSGLAKGFDGECPCCRRRFAEVDDARSM